MIYRERIIQNYIDGYNEFVVDKTVADFDDNIKVENIQNVKITLSLEGVNDFRRQSWQKVILPLDTKQLSYSIMGVTKRK